MAPKIIPHPLSNSSAMWNQVCRSPKTSLDPPSPAARLAFDSYRLPRPKVYGTSNPKVAVRPCHSSLTYTEYLAHSSFFPSRSGKSLRKPTPARPYPTVVAGDSVSSHLFFDWLGIPALPRNPERRGS